MDDCIVSLRRVFASYEGERHAALHDVSLEVQVGEQVGIVGPNGAGKTTLLEVVNGLLPFLSGAVEVHGEPLTPRSHRLRSRIGYVPQEATFPADTPFLVSDVVLAARFGLLSRFRWPTARDRAAARSALTAIGIADLSGRPVWRLSGVQQRKVLIARALAQQASLLLLDEPTANLDPESKLEVAELVEAVRRNLGATALVVSHEDGALLQRADRIVTIVDGRVAASRTEIGGS